MIISTIVISVILGLMLLIFIAFIIFMLLKNKDFNNSIETKFYKFPTFINLNYDLNTNTIYFDRDKKALRFFFNTTELKFHVFSSHIISDNRAKVIETFLSKEYVAINNRSQPISYTITLLLQKFQVDYELTFISYDQEKSLINFSLHKKNDQSSSLYRLQFEQSKSKSIFSENRVLKSTNPKLFRKELKLTNFKKSHLFFVIRFNPKLSVDIQKYNEPSVYINHFLNQNRIKKRKIKILNLLNDNVYVLYYKTRKVPKFFFTIYTINFFSKWNTLLSRFQSSLFFDTELSKVETLLFSFRKNLSEEKTDTLFKLVEIFTSNPHMFKNRIITGDKTKYMNSIIRKWKVSKYNIVKEFDNLQFSKNFLPVINFKSGNILGNIIRNKINLKKYDYNFARFYFRNLSKDIILNFEKISSKIQIKTVVLHQDKIFFTLIPLRLLIFDFDKLVDFLINHKNIVPIFYHYREINKEEIIVSLKKLKAVNVNFGYYHYSDIFETTVFNERFQPLPKYIFIHPYISYNSIRRTKYFASLTQFNKIALEKGCQVVITGVKNNFYIERLKEAQISCFSGAFLRTNRNEPVFTIEDNLEIEQYVKDYKKTNNFFT